MYSALADQSVFGPLATEQLNSMAWAPTKREAEPPPLPIAARPRERSKARGARGSRPPQTDHPGGKGRHSDGPNLTYLMKALARLALQQETAIKILRQDYSWVLFVQPDNQGPLPLLFAATLRTTLFGQS